MRLSYEELVALVRTIHKYNNLSDAAYHVADLSFPEDEDHVGSRWQRPSMQAYGDAVQKLRGAGVIE